MKETFRIFVAVELPGDVKKNIFRVFSELSGEIVNLRAVKEENLHITMKFLGQASLKDIEAAKTTLFSCAGAAERFCVEPAGAGAFPSPGNPRILWAGAEDNGGLLNLQSGIEEGLALLGYDREERPFHPHITTGRIKKPPGGTARRKIELWLEKNRHTRFGAFEVRGFSLFRSVLSPDGASYARLAWFDIKERG